MRPNRADYEVLVDEDIPYNDEEVERLPTTHLIIDSTHNLDNFFSQVYEYHQSGGYVVYLVNIVLTLACFGGLFFLIVCMANCVKWGHIVHPNETVNEWSDVVTPLSICWASLPWFTVLFLIAAIGIFATYGLYQLTEIKEMWGVRRFCTTILDMPTSDSELTDLNWGEVLQRLLNVQNQMSLCPTKDRLDQLDVYNRILRKDNYIIGMVNHSTFPYRFSLPFLSRPYIYLPDYFLFILRIMIFSSPHGPFLTYCQLRPEYKLPERRSELSAHLSKQSRLIGLALFFLSPLVFCARLSFFLFSNSLELRRNPAELFHRCWSNYARIFLRHFNELPHEFEERLNTAYKPATTYLECFPSRFWGVIARHIAFMFGGISLLFFIAGSINSTLTQLPLFFLMMVGAGVVAGVAYSMVQSDHEVHYPRQSLIETLSKIHYMPDQWKEKAHTLEVRSEFAQLFPYRAVRVLEEVASPFLVPLIMIFSMPQYTQAIVDFLRNFTVELEGVGDICSFGQLDILRHGDPEWSPCDVDGGASPSGDEHDVDPTMNLMRLPATCGKTELSLMHFHHTNPSWVPPQDSLAFLKALQKQAICDLQRQQQRQQDFIQNLYGNSSSLLHSLYTAGSNSKAPNSNAPEQHEVKNVSRVSMTSEKPRYGLGSALSESMMKQASQTPTNETQTPAEVASPVLAHRGAAGGMSGIGEGVAGVSKSSSFLMNQVPLPLLGMTPSASLMNASGVYPNQPFMSQMEDRTTLNASCLGASFSYGDLSLEMEFSSLYIHDLHQRRRNAHRMAVAAQVAGSSRVRSGGSSESGLGHQEEMRYQQPTHRYLGMAGRGRLLGAAGVGAGNGGVNGTAVPGSHFSTTRQFEGVVEEEADVEAETEVSPQRRGSPGNDDDSSSPSTAVVPVQQWPNLPPPTC